VRRRRSTTCADAEAGHQSVAVDREPVVNVAPRYVDSVPIRKVAKYAGIVLHDSLIQAIPDNPVDPHPEVLGVYAIVEGRLEHELGLGCGRALKPANELVERALSIATGGQHVRVVACHQKRGITVGRDGVDAALSRLRRVATIIVPAAT